MKNKTTGSLLLLLTALIWGSAFVAQSVGMDYVGPFTFNAARCIIGGVVLIPCIILIDKLNGTAPSVWGEKAKDDKKPLIAGGVLCGIILAVASSLQQFGIKYTTVGKAGFITALYIVIVPVMGIFLRKKIAGAVWLSVGVATFGMYLLCITEGFSLAFGDTLVMLCAVGFSVHILVIDSYAPKVDCVRMSCIQFFVCALLCLIPALIFEKPSLTQIASAWQPVLYAGVMSCGVAYTLQVVGQKHVKPAVASLILSLESVFAVLAGWLFLSQGLTGREIMGCALVFIAIILAQLPEFFAKNKNSSQAAVNNKSDM